MSPIRAADDPVPFAFCRDDACVTLKRGGCIRKISHVNLCHAATTGHEKAGLDHYTFLQCVAPPPFTLSKEGRADVYPPGRSHGVASSIDLLR
ncbi:hypothetical protein EYF80_032204 [Liparis tanakae]|uniref:Uncharacterized protein n=1 Tax=Liparis tanakae TaxID=230148 RepID=A0A4Z2GY66_9TELE|nr:hypothetical protein EYF80_032204 [Liparis tanakae]